MSDYESTYNIISLNIWHAPSEWALLLPAYLIVLISLTYISYLSLMALKSPSSDSLDTIGGKSCH